VVIVSLGLTFLAVLGTWVFAGHSDSQMLTSFWIALIMLPLITLISLRQAALRGLKKVVISQLPEMLIQPVLFIGLIIVAYLLLAKSFRPPWAVGMNVIATGVTLVIGAGLLYKSLPQPVKKASPEYKTGTWVHSALPLLFAAGMQVINAKTDTIMLGAMKGAKTVGIYSVAIRGAELITFILFSVNTVLAPTIASLYAAKDIKQLQQLITKSTRLILLFSLPIGLGLILFSHRFLLLFGHEFTQGRTALTILSAGQLVNATLGSVNLLLVMTGYERDAALGIGISALLNIILNATLIPLWGIEGAATATASSMTLWNILLAIWVYKRLGIHTTPFGKIHLRRD
jgi:O-antigen/teichoic acid export membrane protein